MADNEMNRREFVSITAAIAAAVCATCCCGGAEALAAADADAPGDGKAPPAPPSGGGSKVDAGAVSTYSKDGIWDTFGKSNRVLIVRAGDKIYAPTATCTHKNQLVRL